MAMLWTGFRGLGLALCCVLAHSEASAQDNADMQALTSNVLASIRGETATSQETAQQDLSAIVRQAVAEGQSDDYLAAIVQEAVNEGRLDVPAPMRTTDGGADTKLLVAALVKQSLGTDDQGQTPEDGDASDEDELAKLLQAFDTSGSGETEAATEAPATQTTAEEDADQATEERIHTVVRGESLAGIALRYYGDPLEYSKIFEANREQLTSPDRIQVGQRLRIPG